LDCLGKIIVLDRLLSWTYMVIPTLYGFLDALA